MVHTYDAEALVAADPDRSVGDSKAFGFEAGPRSGTVWIRSPRGWWATARIRSDGLLIHEVWAGR